MLKTIGIHLLSCFILSITVCLLPATVLLFAVSSAVHTQLLCMGLVAFCGVLLTAWNGKNAYRRLKVCAVQLIIAFVFLVLSYAQSPSGKAPPDSNIQSLYLKEGVSFQRMSVANLVAEIDQLNMGAALIPAMDEFIDTAKKERITGLMNTVYSEMNNDPDFLELGSNMRLAYTDIFMQQPDSGHIYVYTPNTTNQTGPLPCLLFLHGSAGNFKGYSWVWKEFADTYGYAIICPSFGAGQWDKAERIQTIERVLTYIENHKALDEDAVALAALSNGGLGLTRLATDFPNRFNAYIGISPVLDYGQVYNDAYQNAIRTTPFLLIHGTADERIPESSNRAIANSLKNAGIDITYQSYANEDHFLFFSKQKEILALIGEFLIPNP